MQQAPISRFLMFHLQRCFIRHASKVAKRGESASRLAAPAAPRILQPGETISSCPPNTELVGLNYLKDQPEVIAKEDHEYPPWLWTLLDPVEHPPGSQQDLKKKRRDASRTEIKERNFMSTQ